MPGVLENAEELASTCCRIRDLCLFTCKLTYLCITLASTVVGKGRDYKSQSFLYHDLICLFVINMFIIP